VPERLWAGPDRSSSQTWKERALGAGHDLIEEVVRVGVRFHTGMAKYTAHLVDADLVILPTRIRSLPSLQESVYFRESGPA